MSDHVSFDEPSVARAATLFSAKRELFPPNTIEGLAKTIVRQLASATEEAVKTARTVTTEESLDAFCDVLCRPSPDAALSFIKERLEEGSSREDIYLGYIGAAARRLGERWDEDEASFTDVTIGSGHLYALMRAMRTEQANVRPATDDQRSALFAAIPGEDHSVGITVAANVFRDAGWEIDLQVDKDHDQLIAHAKDTKPHIIGLSLSTDRRLDALAGLVLALRINLPGATIGVGSGDALAAEKVRAVADVDFLFEDAPSALTKLESLVEQRA